MIDVVAGPLVSVCMDGASMALCMDAEIQEESLHTPCWRDIINMMLLVHQQGNSGGRSHAVAAGRTQL